MDRVIVYPGAIPQDTDILSTNRFAMEAIGYLAETCLGSGTTASGLACAPTSPASLAVTVGRGSLYSLQVIDQAAYGSLPADTTDPLLKVGINTTATSLTFTPPGTAGYSQNFLIEAQFLEAGSGSEVLTYYNSSNPSVPYLGPSNSGSEQYTTLIQRVSLQVKPGTPATSGSQTTPGADSGWTPLYVITVANGQTAINSGNIAVASGAPFVLPYETAISAAIANAAARHGAIAYSTPGTYTFTVPTGVYFLSSIEIWGSGGNGASDGGSGFGAGGGGGAYGRSSLAVTPGQQFTIVVDSAGGHAASYFGTFSSASGTSASGTTPGSGGSSITTSTGGFGVVGQDAGIGGAIGSNTWKSGGGGNAYASPAPNPEFAETGAPLAGAPATTPGAGGSGGVQGGAGGNGAAGLVAVAW